MSHSIAEFAEYCRVLQSITEYYRVIQNITEYFRVFQSISEYYGVLWSITEYKRVLIIASLITADGAYHCPVGNVWPFLAPSGALIAILTY